MFHFIVYTRIDSKSFAYDKVMKSSNEKKLLKVSRRLLRKIRPISSFCSFHVIEDKGSTFSSIKKLDPYFKDASLVKSLFSFIRLVKKHKRLNALDVAAYLLRKYHMNKQNFSMQKTLYYIYADFLKKFRKPFFDANFVAFAWGPVEKDVYRVQKYNEQWLLNNFNFEKKIVQYGMDKNPVDIINKNVKKYSKYFNNVWINGNGWSSEDNLTHRDGTPWSRAINKGENTPISDKNIMKYHYIEEIN